LLKKELLPTVLTCQSTVENIEIDPLQELPKLLTNKPNHTAIAELSGGPVDGLENFISWLPSMMKDYWNGQTLMSGIISDNKGEAIIIPRGMLSSSSSLGSSETRIQQLVLSRSLWS